MTQPNPSYTVKQLSDLAGVSVRTLHYYDEIGLLTPPTVGANGYRYYDDRSLLRLQQILIYREIGLELAQIKDALDDPAFDLITALKSHRAALSSRIDQLHGLIETIDTTIDHLKGETTMSKKQLFKRLTPEEEQNYTRLARLEYGPTLVDESNRRWKGYTDAEKDQIVEEGEAIHRDLLAALEAGQDPTGPTLHAIAERWHDHIRYFYEPPIDVLRGLGELYVNDERFRAVYTKLHPELPEFWRDAIHGYVDELETAEIQRMLDEDAPLQAKTI